jgi:hypothetical protein
MPPRGMRGSLPAVAATVFMSALLVPLALAQLGMPGVQLLTAFAAVTVASIAVAAWGESLLARHSRLNAQLLASSGIRMALPLVLVLIVVIGQGRFGPVEAVLFAVPLYVSMLTADVVSRTRNHPRGATHTSNGIDASASLLSGEAK